MVSDLDTDDDRQEAGENQRIGGGEKDAQLTTTLCVDCKSAAWPTTSYSFTRGILARLSHGSSALAGKAMGGANSATYVLQLFIRCSTMPWWPGNAPHRRIWWAKDTPLRDATLSLTTALFHKPIHPLWKISFDFERMPRSTRIKRVNLWVGDALDDAVHCLFLISPSVL